MQLRTCRFSHTCQSTRQQCNNFIIFINSNSSVIPKHNDLLFKNALDLIHHLHRARCRNRPTPPRRCPVLFDVVTTFTAGGLLSHLHRVAIIKQATSPQATWFLPPPPRCCPLVASMSSRIASCPSSSDLPPLQQTPNHCVAIVSPSPFAGSARNPLPRCRSPSLLATVVLFPNSYVPLTTAFVATVNGPPR